MTRTLLIIGACLGIFLSGAIAGGFVAIRNLDKFTQRKAADQFGQQHYRRIAEQLGLSEEQRKKIRPLLVRAGRDLQDTRRRAASVVERLELDVKAELTPEQREKFEKLRIRFKNPERSLQRTLRDPAPRLRSSDTPAGASPEKSGAEGAEDKSAEP